MLSCPYCNKTFERKSSYDRHLETITHARKRRRADAADIAVKKPRTARPPQHEGFGIRTIYNGFVDVFKIYRASFKRVYNDIAIVTTMLLAHVVYLINGVVTEMNGVKVHLRCTVKFYKAVEPATTIVGYFISRPAIYLHSTDTERQYSAAMASIQKQMEQFTRNGSGWVVERIEKVDVYVNKYDPIRGNTYCKLPRELAKKRAIINVKNRDNKCFMWSVLAALHPAKDHVDRVTNYREYDEGTKHGLIFNDIEHPMALDDITKFEDLNTGLGINVFCYGEKGLYPIRQTDHRDRKIVNLLLLSPEDGPAHYCWIKDMGKLMFGITRYEGRKFVCDYCLCYFNNEKRLIQHQEFCTVDKQRVVVPDNLELKFKNVHRRLRAPYVLYSDFECFIQATNEGDRVHVPNSYGLLGIKRCCKGVPDFEDPVIYRGDDPVRHFLDNLLKKGEEHIRSCCSPMRMTQHQQTEFNSSWKCHICEQVIDGGSKHRDHCHVCGEYRGPAHGKCNLTARTNKDVTVLFHNLKKYDGHLIMQEIGTILEERGLKLECTAKSMEDYLSFVIRLKTGDVSWRIRFVDSLAFLPASLETLVGNLSKDKFTALRKFTRYPDLLSRKGFYPYDKATSPKIFDLIQHQEFCTVDKQRVVVPDDLELKFKNVHRRLRAPYVLYSDFECFIQATNEGDRVHVPNSYGLLGIKRCCKGVPDFEDPVIYRGDDPVRHFLDNLLKKGEEHIRSCCSPMRMTQHQQTEFNSSWKCHICEQVIDGGSKHRDHCHVCGEYRGPAHGKCNLTARTNKDVTVLFHNLKKYDGHLIMQEIGTILEERGLKLECTAKSMEDYLSFVIRLKTGDVSWRIRFVDSLAFLPASLETLVGNLSKDKFTALRKFTRYPDLLSRKGFYPYDKATSPKIFDYPGLFPIDDFYNTLTKEALSTENYEHASHVYDVHDFKNFGQYHDLYLLTDILLLADVFENFRDFVLQHYGLDPVHYITLPSLAWDALLKKTGVKLELLGDPDMYQFFTTGIRGGISVISHRYAKANNKYLSDYDPEASSSYIMYMDANNLYGWAMNQPLPVGGFEWVGEMDAVPSDGYGYVLEVDLEYPPEIHDQHNDYPLAPEKITVPTLSPYCQELKRDLQLGDQEIEKLVPNLMDKTHYIIHHKTLKQCLDLGLKLKKIHRGIRFKEQAWMSTYIQFNTEMRKQATSAFEKDLFKLLNNAVFGKSMENIFNYMDVKLTANEQQYKKYVASPLYRDSRGFKNNLHAVLMTREQAELNKPIYTGFSILELSKLLMYDFHYGYIVPKYGQDAKLLFTDTDSLCYHIRTEDIYDDMKKNEELFDTSDYSTHHKLYSAKNKKVMGKMKDETNGEPVQEFVGLRAKMYSLKCGDDEKKRAKGIARVVVKKEISHKNYRDTLFNSSQMSHTMVQFRSRDHEIYTVNTTKTSLSAYDDKRYILSDGFSTLAYGHKDIDKY